MRRLAPMHGLRSQEIRKTHPLPSRIKRLKEVQFGLRGLPGAKNDGSVVPRCNASYICCLLAGWLVVHLLRRRVSRVREPGCLVWQHKP